MKLPKELSHAELDGLLDPSGEKPELYEDLVSKLMQQFDAENRDMDILHPTSWRSAPVASKRSSAEHQFRADVDTIETLDRRAEGQLARRVEFARLRLSKACKAAGVCEDQCLDGVGKKAAVYSGNLEMTQPVPAVVLRRAAELHALRTEMVERNLYLVLINVERFARSGSSRYDLIQEGSAALFRAVDGFDWRRGLLFRTYAVHWLNQAFRNHLYNFGNTVRVPVYLQKALKHINQAQIQLGKPKATPLEIADSADMNESLVASAMAAARSSYSIDSALSDDGDGNRLRDLLAAGESEDGLYSPRLEDVSLEEGIGKALGRLSDRERLVVTLRYGLGAEQECTLAEVAKRLGVSVERVRQIQVRAVAKLDTPGLRREMDPFLN